ncbi:MAG TPA: nucleotidyltransferase domain-containing protein [Ferrovibrio sp.]|uniref:nucleotidyltransferase domain-containing protein n=1 Tax=Ferrovibrio sp. TaxID=1917215 RepID=UPI002ED05EC9
MASGASGSSGNSGSNQDRLLKRIVAALAPLPGIDAIVLGGSRARGTALPDSDCDIGLYYDPRHPFDTALLQTALARLADAPASLTPLGGWGPWIDGGGWLSVDGRRVDLLYRDLHRMRAAIDDCCMGRIATHYQPGHPHGFVSSTYMGEVAHGRALWDPTNAFGAMKRLTAPYPGALRAALEQAFQWEAECALANAENSLGHGDACYVSGCAFRSVASLCQVLFALNGEYLLDEKDAVARADGFTLAPRHFRDGVASVFQDIGAGHPEDGLERLRQMVRETAALARGGDV